jgi:hypothetical protein
MSERLVDFIAFQDSIRTALDEQIRLLPRVL